MNKYKEKPFELLRKKNNEFFSKETIRNWYIARAFVLEKLRELEGNELFSPNSNKHLHVVLMDDDNRMLSVARQIALSAHYLNFDEDCEGEMSRQRTIITIVTHDKDIKERLSREEFLCNLPKYCTYVEGGIKENSDSYIDIEIHIESECLPKDKDDVILYFHKFDVDSFFNNVKEEDDDIFSIDTRKAYYTNRMYNIGETIDNLPAENIHDTSRYLMALNVYRYEILAENPQLLFENGKMNQYQIKETLSNVFCSDCFESRANVIRKLSGGNLKKENELWKKYNEVLSKSEHARWVVEKLIMGYRSLNEEERHRDEVLRSQSKSGIKLKRYHNSLKRDDKILAHIDLCSYLDVRRRNPDDLKYDSFLMLAIPKILQRIEKDLI